MKDLGNSPATRGDLRRLDAKIDKLDVKIDEAVVRLDAKIDEGDARLGTKIDEVDARLGAKIDEVDARLGAKIDEVDARLGAKIDEVDARLGTKIDGVDRKVDRVIVEVVRLQGDVRDIKDKMGVLATKQDISILSKYADDMTAKGEMYAQKARTHGSMFIDIEGKILDHERRIARLETGPTPPQGP